MVTQSVTFIVTEYIERRVEIEPQYVYGPHVSVALKSKAEAQKVGSEFLLRLTYFFIYSLI